MALKKSDLYASLWSSCDELRGGMDASQYKDYILTLLFVKYVSDKYADAQYGEIVIPAGSSWQDIMKLQGDPKIGEGINIAVAAIAQQNDLVGVVDLANFNDGDKLGGSKERQDKLTKLLGIFDSIEFGASTASGDDLLGDAYEYLMRHFATESGKSKGQFYTPAEVSRVLARLVGINRAESQRQTVYDPTCGSGSLLLKAADLAPAGVTIYGQEMDNATWALARMNMIMHGHPTADIAKGNTLAEPFFKEEAGGLKRFDYLVANPPFSSKGWTSGVDIANDPFSRFTHGVPPAKNGDYAFLLHMLASLKSTGTAATILPHGVLFRGNAEANIRRNLIRQGYIKAVVGLPANLFYGTGIPACIVVLDKAGAAERDSIFMIDASRGFIKDGNKNRLRERDIHQIVDTYDTGLEVERYSRRVPIEEIAEAANDYNLNIARYIDPVEPPDRHDLDAHLNGGIPTADIGALEDVWAAMPNLRGRLFRSAGRPGYEELVVDPSDLLDTIHSDDDFARVARQVTDAITEWADAHRDRLRTIGPDTLSKELFHELSEDLLARFADVPLVDRYAAFQAFADYWNETMEDDVVLVAQVGWEQAARLQPVQKKGNKWPDSDIISGSSKSQRRYHAALNKPDVVVSVLLGDLEAIVAAARTRVAEVVATLEEFVEEHSGEGGALEGLANSSGGVVVGDVRDRVDEIKAQILDLYGSESTLGKVAREIKKTSFETNEWAEGLEDPEGLFAELDTLRGALCQHEAARKAKSDLADAEAALSASLVEAYSRLTPAQIHDLTIERKWFAAVEQRVLGILDARTRLGSQRLGQLADRYNLTYHAVETRAEASSRLVHQHIDMLISGSQG